MQATHTDYVVISNPKTGREHTIQFTISPDSEQYPQHEHGTGLALYYDINNIVNAGIPYSQTDRIRPIHISMLSGQNKQLFCESISDTEKTEKNNPCILKHLKYRDVYNSIVWGSDD